MPRGSTHPLVALLSETGEENEILFLDSGNAPCSVNPELPMPIRGLRAEAYHTLETYLSHHTGADVSHGLCPACAKETEEEWAREMEEEGKKSL